MRRTFITQMSSSTEIANVQAVSGHKNIKVLSDYIKRNDKELNTIRFNINEILYKDDEYDETKPTKPVRSQVVVSKGISK